MAVWALPPLHLKPTSKSSHLIRLVFIKSSCSPAIQRRHNQYKITKCQPPERRDSFTRTRISAHILQPTLIHHRTPVILLILWNRSQMRVRYCLYFISLLWSRGKMTNVQLCTWKQNVPRNPYEDLVEKCLVPIIHLALFWILDTKNNKQIKQKTFMAFVWLTF